MYTQCPECDVAFRVTAEVLKQAAGKVRCGGCGVAFNALLHLSEAIPAAAAQSSPEPGAPQLTADEPADAESLPKSISAEQSAALLKTLDQLAGDDIRIEDTGVEWRVLDQDEENDESIDDDVEPTVAHEEMRFDDNTPLPEDFDLDAASTTAPEPAEEILEPTASIEDSQVDLAFGEPDEWEDLLDDLDDAAIAESDTDEEEIEFVATPFEKSDISAELAALPDIEEIEAEVEAEIEASDQPLDMDTQFAIQAEAMGIDLSGIHSKPDAADDEGEVDKASETSIDEDLISAAFEVEAAAKAAASMAESLAPEEMSRAGILDEDNYLEEITEEVELEEAAELENEAELEEAAEPEEEAELEEAAEPDEETELDEEAELEEEDAELEEEAELKKRPNSKRKQNLKKTLSSTRKQNSK